MLPILSLAVLAADGSGALWPHLLRYVVPDAAVETLLLLAGTGIVVSGIGTACAWLVAAYDFPGRRILGWALLLPLAVPTYLVAYAYLDVLHPLGPVQSALRVALGVADPRGLWFPEVRSLPGCALLIGLVLYPYVYLGARAAFAMQAGVLIDAARGLGATGLKLFRRVALPLAWPAVAIGTGLALMETLNDVGATEFLGVHTLTLAVYTTWIARSSLEGAAQIALLLLALVALLLAAERWVRSRSLPPSLAVGAAPVPLGRVRLRGIGAGMAVAACGVPVLLGFAVPALHLAVAATVRVRQFGLPDDLGRWMLNSAMLAGLAAVAVVMVGLLLAFARRRSGRGGPLRVGSLGYALPGTVLAAGLLAPLGAFDNGIDAAVRAAFGLSTGLLLSGSGVALVLAYVIRFTAIPAGGADAGYTAIPRVLDDAAAGAGAGSARLLTRVHIPLLGPALGAAGLLAFVDCMKELPATLLLRPLGMETLATAVYGEAARGTYENGAVAALAIVVLGLIPVLLLGVRQRRHSE